MSETTFHPIVLGEEGSLYRLLLRTAPKASGTQPVDDLFMWIFWFCVAWFVVLMGLMVYWVIKYRRRPGKAAPRSSSHNTPLEVAWTVLPTFALAYMFFEGFRTYIHSIVAPGNSEELVLRAFQWDWEMTYPGGGTTAEKSNVDPVSGGQMASTPRPVFYVPARRPVKVRMYSTDVIHSFWVPDFRVKQDVMPNRYTSVWFEADEPTGRTRFSSDETTPEYLRGQPYEDHWVFCAEYCGVSHGEMLAIVRVVPDRVYREWLESIQIPEDPAEWGKILHATKCASCHSVDGSPNTGPTWKGRFGTMIDLESGQQVLYDENYVRESILNPQAKITKGYGPTSSMTIQNLDDKQIEAVIAYMKQIANGGQ